MMGVLKDGDSTAADGGSSLHQDNDTQHTSNHDLYTMLSLRTQLSPLLRMQRLEV